MTSSFSTRWMATLLAASLITLPASAASQAPQQSPNPQQPTTTGPSTSGQTPGSDQPAPGQPQTTDQQSTNPTNTSGPAPVPQRETREQGRCECNRQSGRWQGSRLLFA